MRGLTPDEREMWSKVTKDVTPLGSTPVSPVEQSIVLPATTPRAKPFRPVLIGLGDI